MHIFVVDDDAAVATSLKVLLNGYGYKCSSFRDGQEFLNSHEGKPSCVILDVRLPGMSGLQVLQEYRKVEPKIPVIILTGHGDVSMAVDALHHGANDFLEKPFPPSTLVSRIEQAVEKAKNDIRCQEKLETLTPREMEVMKAVVEGHANKLIAHKLGISQKTVELHRARVMEKTGANSVSQLVRTALNGGLEPIE